MSRQITTAGIVIARVDFQEADRIVTMMTPDHGKLSLLAKGVRRIRSKLAGGIELFSISEISYFEGRRDIHTLISTRLQKHYGNIAKNLERTTYGYSVLKTVHKLTDTEPESGYFYLLRDVFEQLDDFEIPLPVIEVWFTMQILMLLGHTPNMATDAAGAKLVAGDRYTFDLESMSFAKHPEGQYHENHIKLLRLMLANPPQAIMQVRGATGLADELLQLARLLIKRYS